jgi:hypothetical protein
MTFARKMQPELRREIEYLNLSMVNESKVTMEVEPTLEAEIQEGPRRCKIEGDMIVDLG